MKHYTINHTLHKFSPEVQVKCNEHIKECLVRVEDALTDTANYIRAECMNEVFDMYLDHMTPDDIRRENKDYEFEFAFQEYAHEQLMLLLIKLIGQRNCQLDTDFTL